MCGIVGVLSEHEAAPILVDALRRLEYRGYDSAGVATINDAGELHRRRATGKLINLSDLLVHQPLPGKAGIGHTRWATHGAPNLTNTHPHRAGRVSVVHNGIIENFQDLRAQLAAMNIAHETDTDTEIVALLTQSYLDQGLSPRDAVEQTIARLDGAYALCFLFDGEEDLLIAARKGSPLAIGHGEGEVYVGSDAIALAPMTNRITYLEEGDWAVLTRNSVEIIDKHGRRANRRVRRIKVDATHIDKGSHKHFMAKEIAEQPSVLVDAISHYVATDGQSIQIPGQGIDFQAFDRIVMVACGTAYYACMTAKYWIEELAGLAVEVDVASEFRYRTPPMGAKTLAIFVSQSGETADTLAALRYCRGKARLIAAVVNVAESSIARESDLALPIFAGPEIGVASTKAFSCQLAVLFALALKAQADRAATESGARFDLIDQLQSMPGLVNQALDMSGQIKKVARKLAGAQDVLFIGRGRMFPLALEGALKLKEISYIHAEAYPSGELKHGPIALIDKDVPVVVMAPSDGLFEKTVSNMQEIMARNGKIVLITDAKGARNAGAGCWEIIQMPKVPDLLAPVLYAVPAQLLAYHTAVAKGTDVDQPRNLAKSVTVE